MTWLDELSWAQNEFDPFKTYVRLESNPDHMDELVSEVVAIQDEQIKKPKGTKEKPQMNKLVYLVSQFKLQSHINMVKVCLILHDLNLMQQIYSLIGSRSEIEKT